jgi:hypothetical protein
MHVAQHVAAFDLSNKAAMRDHWASTGSTIHPEFDLHFFLGAGAGRGECWLFRLTVSSA